MGISLSRAKPDFEILVKTGDVKGSGTDSNVFCCLVDKAGNTSRDLRLDCKFRNDFENGSQDLFKVTNVQNVEDVQCVQLWRDSQGIGDDWFLELIQVRKFDNSQRSRPQSKQLDEKPANDMNNNGVGEWSPFPVNRWIEPNKRYHFSLYDSVLPQCDSKSAQREEELAEKMKNYSYEDEITGLPRKVKKCPKSETFSSDYKWDITSRKVKYLAQKKIQSIFNKDR